MKNIFRNLSWILSTIFVFMALVFSSQRSNQFVPVTEFSISWLAILWLIGSLFSVVSGIITIIIGYTKGLCKFLNASSALIFLIFIIVWLIPGETTGTIGIRDLNWLDWVKAFMVFGPVITRIWAEIISAREFIHHFDHTMKRCSFEEW